METAQEKIGLVKEALRREFDLSTETGGGLDPKTRVYACYTRDIVSAEMQQACGLNMNQFFGALDALEEEGFLLWYAPTPTKERLDPALETLRIAFPTTFGKAAESIAWLTYSPSVRDIVINDQYVVAHPDFNSENERFFEYVFDRPGIRITREELVAAKVTKSPSAAVTDLGFTGALREVFFPGVSTNGVLFRKTLSESDFEGLDRKGYLEQLRSLKKLGSKRK